VRVASSATLVAGVLDGATVGVTRGETPPHAASSSPSTPATPAFNNRAMCEPSLNGDYTKQRAKTP
jgi:hypothetical protein